MFDTVADPRALSTPAMKHVELLTPPPIGKGTRLRASMGGANTQMLVELTDFERPHRLGSRTTSSPMETSGALPFSPTGDATAFELIESAPARRYATSRRNRRLILPEPRCGLVRHARSGRGSGSS